MVIMNYILKVTLTNNKSSKYLYQVLDESGTVISTRRSNRKYMACTADGQYYFGRLDLIGKGDHGSAIKFYTDRLNGYPQGTPEYISRVDPKEALERLNSIAYVVQGIWDDIAVEEFEIKKYNGRR
jgi:hypothetical protein